jgi:hypothetical protein
MSRNGPTWVSPALFTRPSIRPKRSITRSTSRVAWPPSATSASKQSPSDPVARTFSTIARAAAAPVR